MIPANVRPLILTLLYGLAAGLVAVAFQVVIHELRHEGIDRFAEMSPLHFAVGSLLVIFVTSLIAGILLYKVAPEAGGSGIPQLKMAYWQKFGVVPLKVVITKFVAGALTIGGGASLGREGPSVQLGGGAASGVASLLGVAKQRRRAAAAAGAAAGLAAAFNTPLTAIVFVLEEVIEDMNSRLLGSVILASVVGAMVVHWLIGEQPAFQLYPIENHSWYVYLIVPFAAGFAALSGVAFLHGTLWIRGRVRKWNRVPNWFKPALGALVAWMIGVSIFLGTGHLGIFGLGYEDLTQALEGELAWKLAGLLLVGKLIATACCYGFNGCGGIFAPTLFFGGMSAVFFTGVLGFFFPLDLNDRILLAVVGLSACLGAVVRAPITSILIVFEMTQQFAFVPSLLLGTLVSQWIARKLTPSNFYDAMLGQDGIDIHKVVPPRDLHGYRQLPVSVIANFDPKFAESLEPDSLRRLIAEYRHKRFPVLRAGKIDGVITRREIERALEEGGEPQVEKCATCLRSTTIAQLQRSILDSPEGMAVVFDKTEGTAVGVVTLHDLLRAEEAIGKQLGN